MNFTWLIYNKKGIFSREKQVNLKKGLGSTIIRIMDNKYSSLANHILGDNTYHSMIEGKKRLSAFFSTLPPVLKAGLSYKELSVYSREILSPYEDLILSIIPEEIPFHYDRLDRYLEEGSLITVDCAIKIDRLWADGAATFGVGRLDKRRQSFLNKAEKVFLLAKEHSIRGTSFSETQKAISDFLKEGPCQLVENCGGHGIGYSLHQGCDYIYSDRESTLVFPMDEAFTVEPVISFSLGDEGSKEIFAYFEETLIPQE